MKPYANRLLLALCVVVLSAGYSDNTHAYSCTTAILTGTSGCEAGTFIYDTPGHIAIDNPFGIDDWVVLDTSNDYADDLLAGFIIATTRGTRSGAWAITAPNMNFENPWDTYDQLMITLQGGLGHYVAFTLEPGQLAGAFAIIGAADLNHARLWGSVAVVPIPAAIWLFGSGLIAIISISRRSAG